MENKDNKTDTNGYTKEFITCPITSMIFLDPVTARDGIIYERKAIEQWFEEKNTSPLTADEIKNKLMPAYAIKSIVEYFLKANPEWIKEQYVPPKLDHMANHELVDEILQEKKYDQLFKYHNFDMQNLKNNDEYFFLFLDQAPFEIIKYVIDNTIDLEPINKYHTLHYIAKKGRSELVIYLIKKDLELENRDNAGKTVLHYICEKCNIDVINYAMEKIFSSKITSNTNMKCIHYILHNEILTDEEMAMILEKFNDPDDLEYSTKKNNRPIHFACKNMGPKTIAYLIDKKVNLDTPNRDGMYPIHHLIDNEKIDDLDKIVLLEKFKNLEHKNSEGQRPIHRACNLKVDKHDSLIKYLVDKNVELNCPDNDNWNPIHYLCNETPYVSMIIYLLMKKVDLECKTNNGQKPVHMLAKPSTLSVLKLLINSGAQMEDKR